MKHLKSFLFLIIILILLKIVSAAEIQNASIDIEISGLKTTISYKIISSLQQIQLILPKDAKIERISEENYSLKENKLICSGNINLSYSTEELIEKTSKSYFTADLNFPYTENLKINLFLPEFSILENSYPPAEITSDGRHIILRWHFQNISNFPIFVIYREKKTNLAWIWAIITLILAIIILLIYTSSKRKKIKQKKAKPLKEEHLLESESAVVKALKEAKGEMWQKQIQLKTGFSKAKLSRIIRNLEARKFIKRIPLGNTNKIKLIK
ncbi:MAG: hypothetical protein QW041_01805 [Candidatus Pacearchaeota archaeon]